MSQQSLRQASVRAIGGTTGTYEGDWHAMWDVQSIVAGTFNERMTAYVNEKLGTSYTDVNGAMAALAADQGADNFQSMGTFDASTWVPYAGSAVHLDFVNRKYYWNGAKRLEAAFTTFTGAVFGTGAAAGLTGAGVAADHDITIAWADLNIAAPFVMATVFRPAVLPGTNMHVVNIDAAATPIQNRTTHVVTTGSAANAQTLVANVSQASQGGTVLTVNTNYAMATLVQTSLFRNSLNGATSGTENTSGALPTYANLRLLESGSGTLPFQGAIRHVLFFQNTGGAEISQVDLNTLSTALAAI